MRELVASRHVTDGQINGASEVTRGTSPGLSRPDPCHSEDPVLGAGVVPLRNAK